MDVLVKKPKHNPLSKHEFKNDGLETSQVNALCIGEGVKSVISGYGAGSGE